MALEGKLSDFGFAEILQLIETQQKSGYLRITARLPMVFVFDKGTLISTRDRRRETPDPLERYLRRYGFFDQTQWKHIDFIKQNSSLDLTEILISEQLIDDDQLGPLLEAVAQEITHAATKANQGDFVFTPAREPAAGVQGRIEMSVQGLLMEAARRVDEDKRLREIFHSPQIVFQRGSGTPDTEQMNATNRRIFKMALASQPLGKIISEAQVCSFITRNTLFQFCNDKLLVPVSDETRDEAAADESTSDRPSRRFLPFLRSPALALVALVALGTIGFLRWQPVFQENGPDAGLYDQKTDIESMDFDQEQNRQLRLRQLRHDVQSALEIFKYRHGRYPLDLSLLVKEAILPATTYRSAVELGWGYIPNEKSTAYRLRS